MKRILWMIVSLFVLATSAQAQGIDFNTTYNKAQTLYNQKEYEKAIKMLETLNKSGLKITAGDKAKANNLTKECRRAIAFRDRLELSSESVSVGYASGTDSLAFDAGRPAQVTAVSSESWCTVTGIDNGQIYLRTDFNPDKTERTATVTVAMAKIRTASFTVVQSARPETAKTVIFTTTPHNARVTVDNGETRTSECEVTLQSGQHRIQFRKSGYTPRDTTISVADDMRGDSVHVHMNLTPTFGRIKLNILPESGFSFGQNPPVCTMNGIQVNQAQDVYYYSYDDDREIDRAYYTVHDDGNIPVPPSSKITIIASAEHFQTAQETVIVPANTTREITIELKANAGVLTLSDTGNASDAKVFLDDEYIGEVRDITRRPILTGDHLITIRKDGYLSTESEYPVFIRKGELVNISVSMIPYAEYVFTSSEPDAQVYVNGLFIGTTPTKPYLLKDDQPNGVYKIEIMKDNFLPVVRKLRPEFHSTEVKTVSVDLIPCSPLTITADEEKMQVTIKNKRNGDTTFVNRANLPTVVMLPVRKEPYYLELHRAGLSRTAYRHSLHFDDPAKNKRHYQAWSRSNFQILGVNYCLNGGTTRTPELSPNGYRFLGNINLLNFRLCPGLSTSVLRGTAFLGNQAEWTFPHGGSEVPVRNAIALPAISALYINGDFRIGGAIFDYMDVDALVSYAWYPNILSETFRFSHVTGHDLFLGLELSSRTPVLNANVRMGMQMFPGLTARLYCGTSSSTLKNSYETFAMDIPTAFVCSVGFTLGGRGSKGNNILRLF